MKVLFFSHQAEFIYGGEVCTLAFMAELVRQGVEVHFASPPGPYAEKARQLARWHEIPSVQFSRQVSQLPRIGQAWWHTEQSLSRIVSENKIDLLHATSLKAMVYAWTMGGTLPVVWHHHDILPPGFWNNRWAQLLAKGARLVLTPSGATRLSLLEAGVPAGKVSVLNNGFRPEEWARRSPPSGGSIQLGYLGELSRRKGVDLLPGILRECRKSFPCQISLAGEAVSDPDFGAKIRREFTEGEFVGRQSNVKSWLQEIDVLLVPSRQDPLPTVIVEAGLSGVPVVASPVGGIPEMIREGENGFLARDPAQWAEAVGRLRDPERWAACSAGARALAEARYDIAALTRRLLAEYSALLSR